MKPRRPKLLIALALGLGGLLALAVLWQFRDYLTRERFQVAIEGFAAMGPWVFFGLMAVLPLFWVPVSPFLLLAPAFGRAEAVIGSAIALSVNLLLAWLLSGKLFRPLCARLVARFGYSIPDLPANRMVGVALLLRLTPGMPFPLQNYLLGLARMPLGKYLAVSLPVVWATSAGVVLMGESILKGDIQLALIAIAVVVVLALVLRFWRGRLKARSIAEGDC